METMSLDQHCKREIQSYIEQPVVDSDYNPLDWWREQRKVFPLLSKLSKKYLCIPGASVPSERIFSKGGVIVDPFYSRLSTSQVNTLIFLSRNLD